MRDVNKNKGGGFKKTGGGVFFVRKSRQFLEYLDILGGKSFQGLGGRKLLGNLGNYKKNKGTCWESCEGLWKIEVFVGKVVFFWDLWLKIRVFIEK